MRTDLKALLQRADEEKYAVIAFNFSDAWDLLGIIRAAEQENAPVAAAAVPPIFSNHGVRMLAAMAAAAAQNAKTQVVPHLDHSNSIALCMDAIVNGFPSVMIDASQHPLEQNIAITRPVVDYARPRGIHVEGELGRIMGTNWEGVFVDGDNYLTDVGQAVEFVEKTGVDSLAVGIGSGHGFYVDEPVLNIKRLAEINAATTVKLVLHGGTGIPEKQIREAIHNGINKINVGTLIHTSYLDAVKKSLNAIPDRNYPLEIFNDAVEAVAEAARGWIRISGSGGKSR